MSELDLHSVIEGNSLFVEFKGALTEQYVLQQIISDTEYSPYYYGTESATSIRLSLLNYKEQDWMVNIPLYAVCNM